MTRGGLAARTVASGGALDRLLAAFPRARRPLRTCVQIINAPFARARLRKHLTRVQRPIRLEIGGTQPRHGWVVTNVSAVTRFYLDATQRWPFADDTLEYVYQDNVIEHLTLNAGRAMLKEARRCLQPGGTIRIVTPDLRAHVDMYLSGENALASEASVHYQSLGLVVEHPIDLVRIPIASFGHHEGYLYDFDTLTTELERAGFTRAVRVELGTSGHDALRGLDIRSHEGGAQLAVEATA